MTWELLLAGMSSAGALAFFVAGRLTSRRQADGNASKTDNLRLEIDRLQGEVTGQRAEVQRLKNLQHEDDKQAAADQAAAEGDHRRLQAALDAAEKQTALLQRKAATLEEERRAQAVIAKRTGDLLEDRTRKLADAETRLEGKTQEAQRWQQKIAEAETRLAAVEARPAAAVSPDATQALRKDLALKTEQLATRSQAVLRLEAETAALRQELAAQASRATEVEWLRAENASLRAQAFAARAVPLNKAIDLDGSKGVSRGSVLQSLVERVSRLGDIRCAVIADDLGLVVASHGELGEEVAAVGALFGRAGLQAQQVLPLQNVERVTVEDNLGVVLAIRPLRSERQDDPDLTLITLAVGTGPDQRLLNKLIAEGPRLALSP